jgi:hypothetical protein
MTVTCLARCSLAAASGEGQIDVGGSGYGQEQRQLEVVAGEGGSEDRGELVGGGGERL